MSGKWQVDGLVVFGRPVGPLEHLHRLAALATAHERIAALGDGANQVLELCRVRAEPPRVDCVHRVKRLLFEDELPGSVRPADLDLAVDVHAEHRVGAGDQEVHRAEAGLRQLVGHPVVREHSVGPRVDRHAALAGHEPRVRRPLRIHAHRLGADEPAQDVVAVGRVGREGGLLRRVLLPLVLARLEVPPAGRGALDTGHAEPAEAAAVDHPLCRDRGVPPAVLRHDRQADAGLIGRRRPCGAPRRR